VPAAARRDHGVAVGDDEGRARLPVGAPVRVQPGAARVRERPPGRRERVMAMEETRINRRSALLRLGAGAGALTVGGGLAGALRIPGASAASFFASAKRGGTLKAALTGEPDSLDPAKSQIYTGAQVYDNIFSKLVDINPQQQFYGVLAKSWHQPDAKTWVFDLKPGVVFHNGEPFTAADVKYTFERILAPKTGSGYSPLYTAIARVEVVNPHRV